MCNAPNHGFVNRKNGQFTFQASASNGDRLTVPCGQCSACRRAKQRNLGTRVWCESQMHADCMFLTLTYADEHLPADLSVSVEVAQRFLKRLRFELGQKREREGLVAIRVRHLGDGEYGGRFQRPHYHFVIFGHFFPDGTYWRTGKKGGSVYRSPTLERLWPFGHSEFGRVTKSTGGYLGKYVVKKVSGEAAGEHYSRVHPVSGEIVRVRREFLLASRFPGIGASWSEKFESDWVHSGFLVIDGVKVPVPPYFVDRLRARDPARARRYKHEVEDRALDLEALYPGRADFERTPERLAVKEELAVLNRRFLSGHDELEIS